MAMMVIVIVVVMIVPIMMMVLMMIFILRDTYEGDCNEYDNDDGEEERHENGDVDHGDGLLHLDLCWCTVS